MNEQNAPFEIEPAEAGSDPNLRQVVIPGSVTEGDLKKVFDNFVEWVGWDDPTCIPAAHKRLGAYQRRLMERKAKIVAKLTVLQEKLDKVNVHFRTAEEKKAEALSYLNLAAEHMGQFASMEVLTAALKKKYQKVIIRPRGRKQPDVAPTIAAPPPRPETPNPKPNGDGEDVSSSEADQRAQKVVQKILDALDCEGMTLSEIKLTTQLDGPELKEALAYLVDHNSVVKANKKYMLPSQGA